MMASLLFRCLSVCFLFSFLSPSAFSEESRSFTVDPEAVLGFQSDWVAKPPSHFNAAFGKDPGLTQESSFRLESQGCDLKQENKKETISWSSEAQLFIPLSYADPGTPQDPNLAKGTARFRNDDASKKALAALVADAKKKKVQIGVSEITDPHSVTFYLSSKFRDPAYIEVLFARKKTLASQAEAHAKALETEAAELKRLAAEMAQKQKTAGALEGDPTGTGQESNKAAP